MNSKMKLFFTLLALTAIASIPSVKPSLHKHDVTKQIDEWIRKLFKVDFDAFRKLFDRLESRCYWTNYTMQENIREYSALGREICFDQIEMNVTEFESPQLYWNFSANTISFFLKKLTFAIRGHIYKCSSSDDDDFARFDTNLYMEKVNFTFTSDKGYTTTEFTYDWEDVWYNDDLDVLWVYYETELDRGVQKKLENKFTTILTDLLYDIFNKNEEFYGSGEFINSLKAIFNAYSEPKNKLVSTHADFFTDEDERYYYLIPKIPYFSFHLESIFIKGIWNLEWMKIKTGISVFTHTLLISDIRGSFVLDFGAKPEKPVKLNFKIDYLALSVNKKMVNVDARCYSINTTNTPITYQQSALIMHRIESTIANSIFPTLTYRPMHDIGSPLDNLNIENVEWKSAKKSFKKWIPFNDASSVSQDSA